MRIDEQIDADGNAIPTTLSLDAAGLLVLAHGDQIAGSLPANAVIAVMRRYGKPLAEGVAPNGDSISLGDGAALHQLRFRAIVDADVRDYLVLMTSDVEPLAAVATHVSAALSHLCRAYGS